MLTQAVIEAKDCPTDVLHISATNKQVEQQNATVVASLNSEVVDVWAEDFKKDTKTGRSLILPHCINGKKQDLSDKIQAALGVRFMLIRILDVEDGLVNGTFRTIADIVTSSKDGKTTTKLVGLKLDNPTTGSKMKVQGKPENLVYIDRFEKHTQV